MIPWVRDEDLPVAAEVCQSFCLDNGAFSAWKSGEPISDWSGYYEWVNAPEWWRVHGDAVKACIRCVMSKAEERSAKR